MWAFELRIRNAEEDAVKCMHHLNHCCHFYVATNGFDPAELIIVSLSEVANVAVGEECLIEKDTEKMMDCPWCTWCSINMSSVKGAQLMKCFLLDVLSRVSSISIGFRTR